MNYKSLKLSLAIALLGTSFSTPSWAMDPLMESYLATSTVGKIITKRALPFFGGNYEVTLLADADLKKCATGGTVIGEANIVQDEPFKFTLQLQIEENQVFNNFQEFFNLSKNKETLQFKNCDYASEENKSRQDNLALRGIYNDSFVLSYHMRLKSLADEPMISLILKAKSLTTPLNRELFELLNIEKEKVLPRDKQPVRTISPKQREDLQTLGKIMEIIDKKL